jgi:iron complex transport system substrate-binding protein
MLTIALLLLGSCGGDSPEKGSAPGPARLISLAPSLTEIVFALDLQDQLVGVTRYCDHPAAARDIAQVGGFFDPSYEEIVALRPDLVLLLESHTTVAGELDKLGIRYLLTPHKKVEDIPRAVQMVGDACGGPRQARELAAQLQTRMAAVQETVADRPRPRALVCIGRDRESGDLAGMHFAGNDGFYNALLQLAGGQNALLDRAVDFPQLSAEGILQTDPDLILELVSRLPAGKTADQIAAQWDRLPACRAVAEGRVHVIVGDHALRPGPRFIEFLEELALLLHPEAFGEEGP